jgi:hypothetical protein
MKNRIASALIALGIIIFFAAPLYVGIAESLNNIEGDGENAYRENTIFEGILGVDIEHSYWQRGQGWEEDWSEIHTAPWQQKLGFDEIITSGQDTYDSGLVHHDPNSSSSQFWWLMFINLIVKLLIPGIFLIPGLILLREPKKSAETKEMELC